MTEDEAVQGNRRRARWMAATVGKVESVWISRREVTQTVD
jgi:hypothetical protein